MNQIKKRAYHKRIKRIGFFLVSLFCLATVDLALSSEQSDSIARKVTILGHRKSSASSPDAGVDEILRLKCRANHDQFKLTVFFTVEESP
jgi:hypothetical protein